jgi:Acyl-CoA reductase (LuxC)
VTPDALRARLAALRAAGEELRGRPARSVIDALAAVLDRWRDPASPERRALERDLPAATGFSAPNVREGLARGLAPWSGDALRSLAERELACGGGLARGYDVTAVLLAGAIPMPTLLSVIAPLAVRSAALVKTAARDPITAPLVARSIAAIDGPLGRCVEVVGFPGTDATCLEVFLSGECVLATGSDETIESVAARLAPHQKLLRHGHRFSLALLGRAACEGAALDDAARGLALDTALWDQLGCLSPIAVYVAGDAAACERVAAALARALDRVGRELPRGAVDARGAALFAHERAGAELRAAAGKPVALHAAEDASWAVVCEPDAVPRPAPLHRFVRVHRLGAPEQLGSALGPLAAQLASVAIAGFGSAEPEVAIRLRLLGASRVCAPGELQAPPLEWPRDGLAPLASLARQLIQD